MSPALFLGDSDPLKKSRNSRIEAPNVTLERRAYRRKHPVRTFFAQRMP